MLALMLLLPVVATALLIWLEWLGSEQAMTLQEIPVEIPAEKSSSRN